MKLFLTSAFLALAALALASELSPVRAQDPKIDFPKASPKATFSEHVGLASVEVEYSRPSMKGRKIFGGLVPFGEVWRTGANDATKITFGADVTVAGQAVPAGTYGLFTIPGEKEWTVILNKVSGQWGSYAYDQKNDQLRVTVAPMRTAEPVETFTISIGALKDDGADLVLAWESTRVTVRVHNDVVKIVLPQIEAAMKSTGKKPYFPAAMFYYEHDLDLKVALGWIDEAIKEQPDAVWMVYRKGLIQAKAGDKAGALASAQAALALAEKALKEPKTASLGTEYKRLSESLIASLGR